MNGFAHRAGALAVDHRDLGEVADNGPVDELGQGELGLVGGHTPQVHLGLGPQGTELVLGALDVLPGLLLGLGLPFHHPDLLLLGGDPEDARLELEDPLLVHRQDGGLGAGFQDGHRVPLLGRTEKGGLLHLGAGPQFILGGVEAVAQAGPLVVHRLPVLLLLGLFPHVAEFVEDLVGGAAGLL